MNTLVYFNERTLANDNAVDSSGLVSFMHEVWPKLWRDGQGISGIVMPREVKARLASLAWQGRGRDARMIATIVSGPAFRKFTPMEREPDVPEADRQRYRANRFMVRNGVQTLHCQALGWSAVRKSYAVGLPGSGEKWNALRYVVAELDAGGSSVSKFLAYCVTRGSQLESPMFNRWFWCASGLMTMMPESQDEERDKHFKLRDQPPPRCRDWSGERWTKDTKSEQVGAQFRPGLRPDDQQMISIVRAALSAAYDSGRFEAAAVYDGTGSKLADGLDKFCHDVACPIGASSGKVATHIEFYVAATYAEEVHVRPTVG